MEELEVRESLAKVQIFTPNSGKGKGTFPFPFFLLMQAVEVVPSSLPLF
jgi:hypothetical protein